MMKVLIADDEPKIRRGLAESIRWDALGMEVCGFAENGQTAIERVQELHPDICLVDICMPLLNGLELIRRIREFAPDTICIVITGYDEFSYAQEAVSAGVFEYILKPVNEQKLRETLLRARSVHSQRQQKEQRLRQAEEVLARHKDMLLETFLGELIQGTLSEEELRERASFLRVQIDRKVGLVRLTIREESIPVQDTERDRQVMRFAVRNVMEEICAEAGPVYFTVDTCGRYCALIDLQQEKAWLDLPDRLEQAIRLFSEIRTNINTAVCPTLSEVPEVFQCWEEEARNALGTIVSGAKRQLQAHFSDPELSASQVARELSVSASYLSRLFKQEMGMTLTDYLTKIRMQEAVRLLGQTELMIYEIAAMVGCHSQHYFCVAFKRLLGMSPSEYKQMLCSRVEK